MVLLSHRMKKAKIHHEYFACVGTIDNGSIPGNTKVNLRWYMTPLYSLHET